MVNIPKHIATADDTAKAIRLFAQEEIEPIHFAEKEDPVIAGLAMLVAATLRALADAVEERDPSSLWTSADLNIKTVVEGIAAVLFPEPCSTQRAMIQYLLIMFAREIKRSAIEC